MKPMKHAVHFVFENIFTTVMHWLTLVHPPITGNQPTAQPIHREGLVQFKQCGIRFEQGLHAEGEVAELTMLWISHSIIVNT